MLLKHTIALAMRLSQLAATTAPNALTHSSSLAYHVCRLCGLRTILKCDVASAILQAPMPDFIFGSFGSDKEPKLFFFGLCFDFDILFLISVFALIFYLLWTARKISKPEQSYGRCHFLEGDKQSWATMINMSLESFVFRWSLLLLCAITSFLFQHNVYFSFFFLCLCSIRPAYPAQTFPGGRLATVQNKFLL